MNGQILYPLLSTGIVLLVILISYYRSNATDFFQRRIFCITLGLIFTAILFHFLGSLLEGRAGFNHHVLLIVFFNLFILFQQGAFYSVAIFIDYLLNKNNRRTINFIYIILGFMAVNVIVLIANHFFGFYFSITKDNFFTYGSVFLVRFYMGYSAILIVIVDIFLCKDKFHGVQTSIIMYFAVSCGIGGVLDIFIPGGNFIWIFLSSAMLIAYLSIIHTDTTIDKITGIGNRSSFVEFMRQIIKMSPRQSYTMALLDINNLKAINSKHGLHTGDKALIEMAALLKQCTRQYDFIARMGNDEFLVAIKDKFNMTRLIERIHEALEELNHRPDRQYIISINYGFDTFVVNKGETADEFLRRLHGLVSKYKEEYNIELASHRKSASH